MKQEAAEAQHICNTRLLTTTHCNTLQHTATHCNTLQHTARRKVKQEAAEAQELREMGEYSQEEEAAVVLEGKHRIAAFKAAAQTLRESVNS